MTPDEMKLFNTLDHYLARANRHMINVNSMRRIRAIADRSCDDSYGFDLLIVQSAIDDSIRHVDKALGKCIGVHTKPFDLAKEGAAS